MGGGNKAGKTAAMEVKTNGCFMDGGKPAGKGQREKKNGEKGSDRKAVEETERPARK